MNKTWFRRSLPVFKFEGNSLNYTVRDTRYIIFSIHDNADKEKKTCVMERDFLKALTKHRKSLQVSTFKFASFEAANAKFNISQLKANNFSRYSQPLSYSALSLYSKESRLKLLINVKLLQYV